MKVFIYAAFDICIRICIRIFFVYLYIYLFIYIYTYVYICTYTNIYIGQKTKPYENKIYLLSSIMTLDRQIWINRSWQWWWKIQSMENSINSSVLSCLIKMNAPLLHQGRYIKPLDGSLTPVHRKDRVLGQLSDQTLILHGTLPKIVCYPYSKDTTECPFWYRIA